MLVTKQRVQLTLGFVWVLVRFFFFFGGGWEWPSRGNNIASSVFPSVLLLFSCFGRVGRNRSVLGAAGRMLIICKPCKDTLLGYETVALQMELPERTAR